MSSREDFARKLQATFVEEAHEHLEVLTGGLLSLEKATEPAVLEKVFRAAHSLKGASRAADRKGIEAICQAVEGIVARYRSGESAPSPGHLNALHDAVDGIGELLELGPTGVLPAMSRILAALAAVESGTAGAETKLSSPRAAPLEAESRPSQEGKTASVRIPVAELDSLLRRAEELMHVKNASDRCAESLQSLVLELDARRGRWNRDSLAAFEANVRAAWKHAEAERYQTAERIGLLLEELDKTFMLPCSTLLDMFPKMIHDLSREKGRSVTLRLTGGEVRIDKRVLDEVRDPLIHLLRNAFDHGIEQAGERVAAGKPAQGTIAVSATQRGANEVELEVSDDGRGIDAGEVKRAAVRRGILPQEEADSLDQRGALDLVFRSDVSTSTEVTTLSGRGIGLTIVRDAVERLSGTVTLHTRRGEGTSFRLRLPVARSTFRGVLIRCGERLFIVPEADIRRVVRAERSALTSLQNLPALAVDGRPVRLVRLSDLLGMPPGRGTEERGTLQALVAAHQESTLAFEVDEVLGTQEILAKPLGPQLVKLRGVAGATLLSTGELVPILRIAELARDALGAGASAAPAATARPAPMKAGPILVVEDSITSRMLLKNILEAAGYAVRTAVDGVEALTLLKTEEFSLVVSDVDMPRMNGFVLTEKMRADARLRQLPVVLVTALEKPEDRERGVEAGANAYIAKSGFDQSSLLKAIERLV